MKFFRCSFLFYLAALCSVALADQMHAAQLLINSSAANGSLVMQNGFVRVDINTVALNVALYADYTGGGDYSQVAANFMQLVKESTSGSISQPSAVQYTVLSNTSSLVAVQLKGIVDDANAPTAQDMWTLSLASSSRSLEVKTEGYVTRASSATTKAYVHRLSFDAISIYAMFSRGVVQMRQLPLAYFAATDYADRIYGLGGGSSYDLDLSTVRQPLILTTMTPNAATGVQMILAGKWTSATDVWEGSWLNCSATNIAANSAWNTSFVVTVTDRNFPAGQLVVSNDNLPEQDLEAYLTGAYGSSPGCLCTYPNEVVQGKQVAQIATTIARPDRGYANTYNYFDPDNFISLSSILYSGDPYLQEQARLVIERSGAFLKPNGQLPHHFEYDQPTYVALSGATQTGPNTFWVKTALQYARVTGNITWLESYMPTLRSAANFCFNLIDTQRKLLDAPGSLMIDVFIREHFTSDSNAMVVGFLREFAEAEQIVGNITGAQLLLQLADDVSAAVDANLWAATGKGLGSNDHYITQLNPDNTTRDFVDYDSNLIAVAHGIPDADRATKVLARIDQGRCAAARGGGPQFVSEVYYGPDDTVNGNIGDSYTAMGRIAWFDAHARKRVGDLATFDNHLLEPLLQELIRVTWMHERYTCAGDEMTNRTDAYFEYPATVVMLLREIRYGINIGLTNMTINPFGVTNFTFGVGNVYVHHSPTDVEVSIPGTSTKLYVISGLRPSTAFQLSAQQNQQSQRRWLDRHDQASPCTLSGTATSDSTGTLIFNGPTGTNCIVKASAV
eukprot:m.30236 g.30236  ORF g.30236 m.30236 type:complete len:789 (+) comp10587_c0_seq1:120-2486(+)